MLRWCTLVATTSSLKIFTYVNTREECLSRGALQLLQRSVVPQSHKDPSRSSVLDEASDAGAKNLVANVALIARALASHIYNLTETPAGQATAASEHSALYDEALVSYNVNRQSDYNLKKKT